VTVRPAPTEPYVREVHGVRTDDPYRWMRNRADPRLIPHLAAERAHYDEVSAGWHPVRSALGAEFAARLPIEEDPVGYRRGPYEYAEHTPVGAEHPQLLRRPLRHPDGDWTVLLDGTAVADGTGHLRYGVCEPSPDGSHLAYSVDVVGDEVYELRFRDTSTGLDLHERIPHTYYGCGWSLDSTVLFYVVHDVSYRPYRVYRHTLGTDPATDALVYSEDDERFHVDVATTRSGEYLVVSTRSRDTSEQWLVPLAAPQKPARLIEPRRPGIEYFAEHRRETAELLLLTNDGAAEYRVMRAPLTEPGPGSWRELVAGSADTRLRELTVYSGHIVLRCQRRGVGFLRVIAEDGTTHDHHPPDEAGLVELYPPGPYDVTSVVASSESLVVPRRWWRIDLRTGSRALLRETRVPGYDPALYTTTLSFVDTDDGERVPVTFAYRNGTTNSGNPCLLWAYGAYERCSRPAYSPALASLLDRGFVYAIAHVRGGGEHGRRWWLDGRLAHKHHTFSDLVAVRDWLVSERWADRVICRGLSAGGLLVGNAYTFRPEKWAGVVAEVPAVDVLNQMLDPAVPLTVNEYDEWGEPAIREQFEWMRAYVPNENVTDRPRPPLLVTGILRDPRVLVYAPARWVAGLRAADTHGNDILFRVELGAGDHKVRSLAYEAEVFAWVLSVALAPAPPATVAVT
jgi:oligopeptidase B